MTAKLALAHLEMAFAGDNATEGGRRLSTRAVGFLRAKAANR